MVQLVFDRLGENSLSSKWHTSKEERKEMISVKWTKELGPISVGMLWFHC